MKIYIIHGYGRHEPDRPGIIVVANGYKEAMEMGVQYGLEKPLSWCCAGHALKSYKKPTLLLINQ